MRKMPHRRNRTLIAMLLAILMLMTSVAMAEDAGERDSKTMPVYSIDDPMFTLHNGTRFGMTKEEIKETEKQAGIILEEPESGVERLQWEGTIADQSDAHLTYYFDNADEVLAELWYSFDDVKGYDAVNALLIGQYGEPDLTEASGGERYGWTLGNGMFNPIHEVQVDHTKSTSYGNDVYSDAQYAQWLYLLEDGSSILISHYKYIFTNTNRSIVNRESHYVIHEHLDSGKTELIMNERGLSAGDGASQNTAEWICRNCQQRNTGNFCVKCGQPKVTPTPVPTPEPTPAPTPEPETWHCRHCTGDNDWAYAYCSYCGAPKSGTALEFKGFPLYKGMTEEEIKEALGGEIPKKDKWGKYELFVKIYYDADDKLDYFTFTINNTYMSIYEFTDMMQSAYGYSGWEKQRDMNGLTHFQTKKTDGFVPSTIL